MTWGKKCSDDPSTKVGIGDQQILSSSPLHKQLGHFHRLGKPVCCEAPKCSVLKFDL